jgi:glycosyltransferase involved in cell wall biosynthesis
MEPKLGLSHARNCGTALARGSFLLFTDDDVLVEDGWADALVGGFSDPGVGMVGGRVLPLWPVNPPAWIQGGPQAAVLSLSDLGSSPRLLGDGEAPIGANMAIRTRCVMGLRHAFDPSLGPHGELKFDYDEVNFAQRIRSEYRLAYRPDALVHHRIQLERMNRSWLRRTYLQHGFGAERHERTIGRVQRHLIYRVAHFALTAVRAWCWRRRNDHCPALDARAVDRELQTFAWVGRTTERLVGRFPSASNWLAERLA